MCTGMIALVYGVIRRSTSAGSRVRVSSTSAGIGTPPTAATADADAIQVYAGTITSSPGPTPIPCRPQISAAVPEVTASARCVPMWAANPCSSSSAFDGPGLGP